MKNNMLSEKDEVKNFRIKVMDKNNMSEMWTHINPSQVEKKFGGEAPDVPMSEHWPPKSPNSDFWCTPSQKNQNYVTKLEYYEMYNKGKLKKSKICFDLVEETAIEKIKAAGDAGKISGLGFKSKNKKNGVSDKGSDELNVKDINIDVIGSNYNGSHSEKGGVERVPSTTNLKDASAGVIAGPKLMASVPMNPCRPDGEEPEFDDEASNMSSMVRMNPAEDADLMLLEAGANKNMEVIVEANENLNTPGLLQTPQNGRVSNGMGSPFLKPKRPSYVYEEIDDFQLTMFSNFQVTGKGD